MDCKQEDNGVLEEMQLNDSFLPSTLISSFQQPEPRLSIRNPQEINQKTYKTTSQTRRRSVSSSPEIQYEGTVIHTNPNHSKAKKSRRDIQRQESSSSCTEVNFQGFQTRYSKMKLVKASLRSTSKGMKSYLEINRDFMLGSWERELKPNERSKENERLRHPSQSSFTMMSPSTEFSSSDHFRNPYFNSPLDDPRLRSTNQDHIQSINSSSPRWNPEPPQSFSSPPNESRIPLRIPEPPPPPSLRQPSPPYNPRSDFLNPDPPQTVFRLPSPPYNQRSDFLNPDPPQSSFRLPSPPYGPSSNLQNPDPPQSSFRNYSPPYDPNSDSRNPDPPPTSFRQLSPRNPDRPHFNFQASYENRTCLTNPEPPQYISQPSLEKSLISYENRTCFSNPDPPQINSQSSHEKNILYEEPRSTNKESIASMINNIRNNESTVESSLRRMDSIDFKEDSIDKECSTQQPTHRDNQISDNHEEQDNLENIKVNETIDLEIARRCPVYMKGLKCHKGEYCEKLHRLPREDDVPCMYFKGEGCRRTASDCWFFHPGEKVNEFVVNDDAPVLVPSMGDILEYLRKEQAANPDKYKSKIVPSNEITPAKVVIPAAVGNANHTPLGQRQISRLDPNHSPLLPHLKMSNSTNIVENLSNKELPSPSTVSNTGITSPSNNLAGSNSTENSSIEVSRIKLSKPARVGAPRKQGVENVDNDSNSLTFKIPKKNSVKAKCSSQMKETTTENSKTIETPKNIDIPKNQSSRKNKEKIINTENREIISNDTEKENPVNSNVNDSKKIKSNRTRKDDQNSKIDHKEKEKPKKSKETNAQTKRKARPISESEEESTAVNETIEKMKGKKIKMSNKKSNKSKRSRIESSDESGEDSSQTVVSSNEIVASSSDENISGKGSKKSNIGSKKFENSDRDLNNDSAKEGPRANITRDKKPMSGHEKEDKILPKQILKCNQKGNPSKKSIIESDKVIEENNSKSVITKDKKLKSGAQSKEKIQEKKSKNSTKRINKPRMSRIESSSESETEAPQTEAINDEESSSNMIEEQNVKSNNESKNKKIKVEKEVTKRPIVIEEKEVTKKPIVIEEISLLSDSDEDENDAVVKSETFLSEEVDEINGVRERKALDEILWGIDRELKHLEEASEGAWKRTPNHIVKDLYSVLEEFQIEKFEDSKYPDIYNLDINYRQFFLKISGVEDVQKHALLCKIKYPNCKNILKDHKEDMSCCR